LKFLHPLKTLPSQITTKEPMKFGLKNQIFIITVLVTADNVKRSELNQTWIMYSECAQWLSGGSLSYGL